VFAAGCCCWLLLLAAPAGCSCWLLAAAAIYGGCRRGGHTHTHTHMLFVLSIIELHSIQYYVICTVCVSFVVKHKCICVHVPVAPLKAYVSPACRQQIHWRRARREHEHGHTNSGGRGLRHTERFCSWVGLTATDRNKDKHKNKNTPITRKSAERRIALHVRPLIFPARSCSCGRRAVFSGAEKKQREIREKAESARDRERWEASTAR
jgi:hypothetical protein